MSLKLSFPDDGIINARQGHEVRLDIYGVGLVEDSEVKLTSSVASAGHACKSQGLHVQVTVRLGLVRLGKVRLG